MRKLSKTTWLLILVFVLSLGYFLAKYLAKPRRSVEYRSVLVDFSEDKLSKFRITQAGQKAELTKVGDSWQVALPDGRQVTADTTRVREVLDILLRIRPARMYAKTKRIWSEIDVDSTGIRVEAFEAEAKVLDLVLGRSFPDQGSYNTYVRLFDDSISYVASNVVSYNIQPHPNEYRPIKILNVEADSIQSIVFQDLETSQKLSLQRQDTLWLLQSDPPQAIGEQAMFAYLADISTLSSNSFEDDFSPTQSAQRSVQLTTTKETKNVYLYRDQRSWILQSSQDPSTFFRDSTAFDQLWKTSDFFLGLLP